MKKSIYIIMVLALVLSGCSSFDTSAPIVKASGPEPTVATGLDEAAVMAEGKLMPVNAVDLSFAHAGVVSEVLVSQAQDVEKDTVIARLVGVETATAELSAARLEETLARQAVDDLRRSALLVASTSHAALAAAQKDYESKAVGWNAPPEDDMTRLEQAVADYREAEQDLRDARQRLDNLSDRPAGDSKRTSAHEQYVRELTNLQQEYAGLIENLPGPEERLDGNLSDLLESIAMLELARLEVDRQELGVDQEKLAAAESRLAAAVDRCAAAEAQVNLYGLKAPFSGTVLDLDLKAGETVLPGTPVAFLADVSRWEVETTDLAELDIPLVKPDSPVDIELDAFPGEVFSGRVSQINPVGRERQGDLTYTVTIELDEADPRFLWNMTATVKISQ